VAATHVPPTPGPLPDADRAAGSDGLRGFRTPALLVSPLARRGRTSHTLYEHASLLRLIEWRWSLEPLSVRDATANNPALELDFTRARLDAPAFAVPAVSGTACPANPGLVAARGATDARRPTSRDHWEALHEVGRRRGWAV
jgi:phospholipase C